MNTVAAAHSSDGALGLTGENARAQRPGAQLLLVFLCFLVFCLLLFWRRRRLFLFGRRLVCGRTHRFHRGTIWWRRRRILRSHFLAAFRRRCGTIWWRRIRRLRFLRALRRRSRTIRWLLNGRRSRWMVRRLDRLSRRAISGRRRRLVYLRGRGGLRWLLPAGPRLHCVPRRIRRYRRLYYLWGRRSLFDDDGLRRRWRTPPNLLHLLRIQWNAWVSLKRLLSAGKWHRRRRRSRFGDDRPAGHGTWRVRNIRWRVGAAKNCLPLWRNLRRTDHLCR